MGFSEDLQKAIELANDKVEVTFERTDDGKLDVLIRVDDEIESFDIADTDGWTLEQLQNKLAEIRDDLDELEDEEPDEEEVGAEAYEHWENCCAELEQIVDSLEQRIAEMQAAVD